MSPAERRALRAFLAEDLGSAGDVTSRVVLPRACSVVAAVIADEAGVMAGWPYAVELFRLVDRRVRVRALAREGAVVRRGQRLAEIRGSARSILAAERAALNLLGRLSGVATLTRKFVRRISGTRAAIYDTRKTMPGLRAFDKYAVRLGGGRNHRVTLSDQALIKTNHLKALKGLPPHTIHRALIAARRRLRGPIELEVAGAEALLLALLWKADIILLDNMPLSAIRRAVRLRNVLRPSTALEVSGGITLHNVRAVARSGVDRISIGALTKCAPSLDVALRVVPDTTMKHDG